MKWMVVAAVTALSAHVLAAPAIAETPCTDVAKLSHLLSNDNNSKLGGHVNTHVVGRTPPKGESQKDNTLFPDERAYEEAWSTLADQKPPLQCPPDPREGDTRESHFNFKVSARECTAASAAGVCTASSGKETSVVTMVFRAVRLSMPIGPPIRWILYTAYPDAELSRRSGN